MSEYIYWQDDSGLYKREEIVRCRDCKHYNEKTYEWVNGWTRTYTTCSMFDGCRVEPDGYCKLGERREDD